MKIIIRKIVILLLIVHYSNAATVEQAQHRLPPVIYSLNIPKMVEANKEYDFKFSVMGYHDNYDIVMKIWDGDGNVLANESLAAYAVKPGAYGYGQGNGRIESKEFFYTTFLTLNFTDNQELTVRFYASPRNDPIDTNYLSCIVPGGLGYKAGDTTGRKIKIDGIETSVFKTKIANSMHDMQCLNEYFKTSKCYNGFKSHYFGEDSSSSNTYIEIKKISETISNIRVRFEPQDYGEYSFFYNFIFPSKLKISDVKFLGTMEIPQDDGSNAFFSMLGDETLGYIFGSYALPLKIVFGMTESAGDPAYSSYIEENDYISKKYYPYQNISGSFAKTNHIISIDFTVEQPLSEVLNILKEYKTSMYIGNATQNELFIDGMIFSK